MPGSETETRARPSWLADTLTFLLLAAVLAVGVYGFAHVSLRPINPDQKPATKHFGDAKCTMCHQVSGKAKLVEVE